MTESYRRENRSYYCRTCGAQAQATTVPEGWYSLNRHPGTPDLQTARIGLFCSLACLASQLPRLEGIEANIGAAIPYRRRFGGDA